jgi:hypothetical protein
LVPWRQIRSPATPSSSWLMAITSCRLQASLITIVEGGHTG